MRLATLALLIAAAIVPSSAVAEYAVRGEAVIVVPAGPPPPAVCPAAGTRFSAVVRTATRAQCMAHDTCTRAKIDAVTGWVAQMNAGGRAACTHLVQQRQAPCQYSC